jgi:hypothetical protein
MRLPCLLLVGSLTACLAQPATAFAQDPAADAAAGAASARFHLGPLGWSPMLTMGNLGVNTNVFSTPTDPTRDFTVSFVPSTQEWLPVGPLLFSGTTGVPLTYFQKAVTQRSVGFQQQGRVSLNLVHLVPYGSLAYGSTDDQPNAEISVRVQQVVKTATAGAILRISTRTSLDANYTDGSLEYPNAEVFDANIGAQLNRRTTAMALTFRTALTPLTSLVVKSVLGRDRFDNNPLLNTNSVTVLPGLEFKKDALLSGSVSLGVRALRPLSPLVPPFTGLVGSAALSWLARETTRLDGRFDRNVDYSIDETTPYYVTTGGSVSLTQMVVGHVDAMTTVGRSILAYRNALSVPGTPALGRDDRTSTIGGGLGYRFRIDARLGFNITHVTRLSALDGRPYAGYQFGGTMTYGF